MKKALVVILGLSLTGLLSAQGFGPGGMGGGGGNTTGPGNQGNQPDSGGTSSSASFTYDTFITDSDTSTISGVLLRGSVAIGYSDSPTSITLTSDVDEIAIGAFAGCTTLTSIDLSATSITALPAEAFTGCTALTTVTLPSTCVTIGARAFAGCTALTTLTASGLTTIEAEAFRGCTALTTQPTATTLGDYALAYTGLTSVDLDEASLGEGVCAGCNALTSATAPAALPDATFSGCTSLSSFDPSACTSLGIAALAGLPLTELTLASSVTLGAYALAADESDLATTLTYSGSTIPTSDTTTFLGRTLTASYTPVEGSVCRVEAQALVEWLTGDGATLVTAPTSYSTADIETWLSDADNALAFAYASSYAEAETAGETFLPLTIEGTQFVMAAPDSTSTSALTISIEATTSLSGTWSESALTADSALSTDTVTYYSLTDTTATAGFARLVISPTWSTAE